MDNAISSENDQSKRYSEYRAYEDDKYYIVKVFKIIGQLDKEHKFTKSLDVGCADGSFSKKLKDNFGYDVYGLDISQDAVISAQEKGVSARQHNLENRLPYDDGEFDLVVACEIIEHLYDTDFFIGELKRVLKPGGILIMTTPNLVSLSNRARIMMGKYPKFVPEYRVGKAGHIRAYTVPTLQGQISEHGLTVLKVVSPNMTFPMHRAGIPKWMKNAAIKLGDIFPKLGSHIILVAGK